HSSGVVLFCVCCISFSEVVCPVPQIQNGRVSIPKQRYRYKDTVSFQCHEGFVLKGHSTAQCKADRTWHPPVPTCEQGDPGVGQGKAIGSESFYMPGDIITIECNTDNVSKVLHKSQCQSGGTWLPPLPACDRGKPPNILHGGHSGLGKAVFTPGTSVNYSCETGFSLVGMASIYCTESGAWSHPSPVCQGVFLLQGAKKKVQYIMCLRESLSVFTEPGGVEELQNWLLKLDEEMERERARLQKYSALAILQLSLRILISTLSSVSP
uniref:Sushi domain-containing protein n=1 Tax=Pavo cristatus TaxID=9049 RepID=A0A8C9EZE0_PAVCR